MARFPSFYGWIIFHLYTCKQTYLCIHIYIYTIFSLSIHPSIDTLVVTTSWLAWIMWQWPWMYKLAPQEGGFVSFGCMLSSGTAGSHGSLLLSFLRNLYTVFQNSSTQFTPPTAYKGSLCSASSSTFVFSCLFNSRHPNRCEVPPHCVL